MITALKYLNDVASYFSVIIELVSVGLIRPYAGLIDDSEIHSKVCPTDSLQHLFIASSDDMLNSQRNYLFRKQDVSSNALWNLDAATLSDKCYVRLRRQHHCWGVCQMLERSNNPEPTSHGFEISRDLVIYNGSFISHYILSPIQVSCTETIDIQPVMCSPIMQLPDLPMTHVKYIYKHPGISLVGTSSACPQHHWYNY